MMGLTHSWQCTCQHPTLCHIALSVLLFRCLYGGASRGPQGRSLSRGPQLVIATPGRLLDFVTSGELNLNRVSS
jgi:superfamily II DNA/RNA helicase